MSVLRLRRLWPAAAITLAAIAQAGHLAPADRDPLDAAAAVPHARHDGVVARHRSHADQAVAPWKASNETVGRIGGWRAYTREAQADPGSAPASAHRH